MSTFRSKLPQRESRDEAAATLMEQSRDSSSGEKRKRGRQEKHTDAVSSSVATNNRDEEVVLPSLGISRATRGRVGISSRRSFANVDALITRLAPVGTVFVACTESPDDKGKKKKSPIRNISSHLKSELRQQDALFLSSRKGQDENVHKSDDDALSLDVSFL